MLDDATGLKNISLNVIFHHTLQQCFSITNRKSTENLLLVNEILIYLMLKKIIKKLIPTKTPYDDFLDPKKNPLSSFHNLQFLQEVMTFSFSSNEIKKSGDIYIRAICKISPELNEIRLC